MPPRVLTEEQKNEIKAVFEKSKEGLAGKEDKLRQQLSEIDKELDPYYDEAKKVHEKYSYLFDISKDYDKKFEVVDKKAKEKEKLIDGEVENFEKKFKAEKEEALKKAVAEANESVPDVCVHIHFAKEKNEAGPDDTESTIHVVIPKEDQDLQKNILEHNTGSENTQAVAEEMYKSFREKEKELVKKEEAMKQAEQAYNEHLNKMKEAAAKDAKKTDNEPTVAPAKNESAEALEARKAREAEKAEAEKKHAEDIKEAEKKAEDLRKAAEEAKNDYNNAENEIKTARKELTNQAKKLTDQDEHNITGENINNKELTDARENARTFMFISRNDSKSFTAIKEAIKAYQELLQQDDDGKHPEARLEALEKSAGKIEEASSGYLELKKKNSTFGITWSSSGRERKALAEQAVQMAKAIASRLKTVKARVSNMNIRNKVVREVLLKGKTDAINAKYSDTQLADQKFYLKRDLQYKIGSEHVEEVNKLIKERDEKMGDAIKERDAAYEKIRNARADLDRQREEVVKKIDALRIKKPHINVVRRGSIYTRDYVEKRVAETMLNAYQIVNRDDYRDLVNNKHYTPNEIRDVLRKTPEAQERYREIRNERHLDIVDKAQSHEKEAEKNVAPIVF